MAHVKNFKVGNVVVALWETSFRVNNGKIFFCGRHIGETEVREMLTDFYNEMVYEAEEAARNRIAQKASKVMLKLLD